MVVDARTRKLRYLKKRIYTTKKRQIHGCIFCKSCEYRNFHVYVFSKKCFYYNSVIVLRSCKYFAITSAAVPSGQQRKCNLVNDECSQCGKRFLFSTAWQNLLSQLHPGGHTATQTQLVLVWIYRP